MTSCLFFNDILTFYSGFHCSQTAEEPQRDPEKIKKNALQKIVF